MKKSYFFLIAYYMLQITGRLQAQQVTPGSVLRIPELFDRVEKNSLQVKVSLSYVQLVAQQKEIVELNRLPSASSDLNYGYVSNTDIWTPSLSEHFKGENPHHFTQLAISASELLFKGGQLNSAISRAELERQIAVAGHEKTLQDIKFLALAQYLDIYRLMNQGKVYANNTLLAEERLKNILVMKKMGMVTQNDVLRTELLISNYKLASRKIAFSQDLLYTQLNTIIGLPDSVRFLPDSTILSADYALSALDNYFSEAGKLNHELKISKLENSIALENLKMLKADRWPAVFGYAGSLTQRPLLTAIPSKDIYYNVWQAGLGLRYNISSIYQSPRKIKAGKIQVEMAKIKDSLHRQQLGVSVQSGYIKCKESMDELITARGDLKSAEENYRIVEKKYFNQLALLADLIDAGNVKIEAELKVSNAAINVIYHYYQLSKIIGNL